MNRLNRKRLTFLSLSLAVPVILLCVFVVYPFWELIHMSFLEWDGVSSVRSLAGFDNYTQLFFKSPEFWQAFRNNLTYLLIHGIMMPVELVLAVMLSSRFKGSGFVKAIIFLPFIINGVGISYSFSYFFSPVEGGFNYILTRLGMEGLIHNWLSDPKIVNYVLASVSIWRYMGFHIVLFMAGLSSVPKDMMEAAVVDGANAWQRFRYITVPALKPILTTILILDTVWVFKQFTLIWLMTSGGPGSSTMVSAIEIYKNAFSYFKYGFASAQSVYILVICYLIGVVFRRLLRDD